ncbi:MAG: BrnA antitoxin family protein [Oscillatoria sp. PMC 1051.18]|nr:BrnA antitoxin family protein [Oscillatoria sp. PMC 1050.18]MEC5031782.1 BrnA antitoxin family protein [Oscillatoria sp. PMC 1051.18]
MKDNYDFFKVKKGSIIPISEKQIKVNIPLDKEILDWFRAKVHVMGGGDYQALINRALYEYIQCQENQTVN